MDVNGGAWGPGWTHGTNARKALERQVPAMATYVSLLRWTDQGVRNARDTVHRAGAFRADLERRGCKLLGIYWTQGAYDLVTTIEAPDAQAAMASLIALAGLGNV